MVKSYWYLHDLQFDIRIKKNNFSSKKIEEMKQEIELLNSSEKKDNIN